MISIGANGNKQAYGIKHYNLDTVDDLTNIKTERLAMGSTAFIIDTSEQYMLNSNKEWKKVTSPTGSSSSSGGNEIIYDGGGVGTESSDDTIYEGGGV